VFLSSFKDLAKQNQHSNVKYSASSFSPLNDTQKESDYFRNLFSMGNLLGTSFQKLIFCVTRFLIAGKNFPATMLNLFLGEGRRVRARP